LGVVADVLEQERANADEVGRPVSEQSALDAFQALPHAFGGVVWQPHPVLRVDAGARLDVAIVSVAGLAGDTNRDLTTNGDAQVAASPRVVLQWEALPSVRATAAYGRGFRPPEARAFAGEVSQGPETNAASYAGGEPRITTSDAFELGVRYRRARVSAQLSGFLTLIARESVYDHVSGVNLELNGTRRLGAELALRYFATDLLSLHADATVVHARFVNSGNPVPLVPGASGSARVEFGRDLGARGAVRFLTVLPRPLPNGAESSTLSRLDVTAGYHWPLWRLALEIENLLDQRLREGEYHYASHWARGTRPSSLPVLHYVAGAPREARLTVTALF
jgi:outer membrane receptor protein involved in Fe transport